MKINFGSKFGHSDSNIQIPMLFIFLRLICLFQMKMITSAVGVVAVVFFFPECVQSEFRTETGSRTALAVNKAPRARDRRAISRSDLAPLRVCVRIS